MKPDQEKPAPMRLPFTMPFLAAFALSACIVVPIPIEGSGTTTTRMRYPTPPAATAAPASSKCATPARASGEAARVVASVNAQRKAAGLSPVTLSSALTKTAQAHACDNAARGGISHTGTDGSNLTQRLRRQNYLITTAAENTGWGFGSAEQAMAFWMKSPGHRANILNPRMREIGLGLADGSRPSWVMVLGARR
jgi:uncharacterized protein YkwD